MMFIRIKEDAHRYCFSIGVHSQEFKEFLKENAGKLVQVETDHLFNNQYNTDHFRIMDSQIKEVINDARENKGRCKYCGRIISRSEITCFYGPECWNYGVEWFTPQNTFFLKYPSGLPKTEPKISATYNNAIKIGSYDFYTDNICGNDLFILRNTRKTIRFKYDGNRFFVFDSTFEFKQVRFLDIPYTYQIKLLKYLKP